MAIISLGKLDKDFISVVVGCVACFLNRLLNQYDGTLLFKNVILSNIFISISRFLTVIPYIILKIRSKRIKRISDVNNIYTNDIEYIYNHKKKTIRQDKFRYILLSAIIYLTQQILFVLTIQVKTNSWIWIIIITSLFDYLIFKIKLYKHHYLSAILILLIGILIDVVLENIQDDIINNTLYLLIKFVREILFSLYNVLAKYVMEKKFVSVYEFSFYVGTIILILLGIFSIFDYKFFGIDNYEEYFNNFNKTELLVILGEIITQFGINLSSLFTVKNNSPCHIFIMFLFGQLAYYINFEGYSIFAIICLFFILFLSLIFCEIIEINFWGLSSDTKRNIMKRVQSEDEEHIIRSSTIDSNITNDELLIELKEYEKN